MRHQMQLKVFFLVHLVEKPGKDLQIKQLSMLKQPIQLIPVKKKIS
jgi:hypothetical protein